MYDITKLIEGILAPLAPQARADVIGKLQAAAASTTDADGASKVDALQAARDALESDGSYLLTPIMAAAKSDAHRNEVIKLKRELAAFGFDLRSDERVSLVAVDKALSGSERAWNIKARMAALGLISP